MSKRAKVFGIGLNKTGTTTLGLCMQRLGYRHSSFDLRLLEQVRQGRFDDLIALVDEHDSFEDWPYPLAFEQLDSYFPESRFILTRRLSPQAWLRSLEMHALRTDPAVGPRTRSLAYGWPFPQLNPTAHLAFYENHLQRVRRHFQLRAGDLLEVCWEEQASWQPLCRFLGLPEPQDIFPHANAATAPTAERLQQNQSLISQWNAHAGGDDPSLPR